MNPRCAINCETSIELIFQGLTYKVTKYLNVLALVARVFGAATTTNARYRPLRSCDVNMVANYVTHL